VVRRIFEGVVGERAASNAVFLHADICRAELLVEIEAHGCCAPANIPTETITS